MLDNKPTRDMITVQVIDSIDAIGEAGAALQGLVELLRPDGQATGHVDMDRRQLYALLLTLVDKLTDKVAEAKRLALELPQPLERGRSGS